MGSYCRLERLPGDRSASIRFSVQPEVRHQGIRVGDSASGSSETVNISSRGVLFTTSKGFGVGIWSNSSLAGLPQLEGRIVLQLNELAVR